MKNTKKTKLFLNTPPPPDWDIKILREIGKADIGLTYSPEDVVEENQGTLVLRSSNVQDSQIVFEDNVFVKSEIPNRAKIRVGDILICVRNGSRSLIGKSARIDGRCSDMAFGAFMCAFRSQHNDFLFQIFQSGIFQKEINRNLGATINQITSGDLLSFKLPFPPLPEQKAIAHILGLMDEVINKNNKLIAQKELRKKWLMQNLLTGKKRLRGFTDEWKEIHIKDVANEISIKNKADKQLTVLSCTKYDGLVPSLDYFGRKIYADDVSTYKVIPKNHFAYATNHIEEGSIGYQEMFEEGLISPMYTVFKTDETTNDFFFFKLLKSHRLIHEYNARMEGSIDRRGGLRWDAFSIIKVQVPDIKEQTAIAKVLQAADKEIQLLKAKTEKLKEQKKWLMQVLLTGKKRVKID